MHTKAQIDVVSRAVIALFALPWVLAPYHFVTPHRWCPQHRRLEHVEAYSPASDAAGQTLPWNLFGMDVCSKADSSSENADHEACEFLASLFQKDQKPQAVACAGFSMADRSVESPVTGLALPRAVEVLWLAPKHSPPAAA